VLGKDSQDKAAGEDSQGGTAVAGKRQQDIQDKTAGEDSRERTTVAGKRREDSQNMTRQENWTGQPEHDKKGKLDRRTRRGQSWQDNNDRLACRMARI
jgi:hypothetical protein